MSPRVALLGALLACAACSSEPDVVATSRSSGTLPELGVNACKEGLYNGAFFTVDSDGGAALELTGRMEFRLIKDELRGEILRLGDTMLSGEVTQPKAQLSAIVATQECRAGSFQTTMSGEFSLLDETGEKRLTVPFTGEIRGEYRGEEQVFYGEWSTLALVGSLQGRWSAFLVPGL